MRQFKVKCVLLSLVMLASCRRSTPAFYEIKDKELTIQAMDIKATADDDETISYKVRLIPEKRIMEGMHEEEKNKLYYKMDSCFYMNDGKQKNYAALVQPIANGVSGSYEYLLQFETGKNFKADTIDLIYQDRYINHKIYGLKMAGR
jgi:hypothetical protein